YKFFLLKIKIINMYFKILGHILQSRVYKSFPFIYNGCHCKIFEKNLSSFAKVVLSSKPKFTHLQGSLVYPVQFLENNCNVYLYNTQFVRLKSSKSKKSKTQDDKDSDSESEDEGIDFQDTSYKVSTPDLESLLKADLKLEKRKMQQMFDEERIKLNGVKADSGAAMIHEGDRVDITNEPSLGESPTLLRLEVVEVENIDKVTKRQRVKIRKYPKYPLEDKRG
ncbi:hypothetical protein Avbf_03988, partial [Armadillidium vulgare]